jgi:hypothetical protein
VCTVFVILCYCVCNFCVVCCFECVCVILCFLCIVVPLPPGTYPLAVSNNNNNNNNNNNFAIGYLATRNRIFIPVFVLLSFRFI